MKKTKVVKHRRFVPTFPAHNRFDKPLRSYLELELMQTKAKTTPEWLPLPILQIKQSRVGSFEQLPNHTRPNHTRPGIRQKKSWSMLFRQIQPSAAGSAETDAGDDSLETTPDEKVSGNIDSKCGVFKNCLSRKILNNFVHKSRSTTSSALLLLTPHHLTQPFFAQMRESILNAMSPFGRSKAHSRKVTGGGAAAVSEAPLQNFHQRIFIAVPHGWRDGGLRRIPSRLHTECLQIRVHSWLHAIALVSTLHLRLPPRCSPLSFVIHKAVIRISFFLSSFLSSSPCPSRGCNDGRVGLRGN